MKNVLSFCILIFLSAWTAAQQPTEPASQPAVVLLTAGQSNADGRVAIEELPGYIRQNGYTCCLWSYGSGDYRKAPGVFAPFQPAVARADLGRRWGFDAVTYYELEQYLGQTFYVIKQTMGGTAIDTLCSSTNGKYWSADPAFLAHTGSASDGGKSLLKAFTEQIDACIDGYLASLPGGYDIKAMLWHQGESDRTRGDRYYDNLKAVVACIRSHLVQKTRRPQYARLPVICGTFNAASRQGSQQVTDALRKLEAEDPDFHVIDASDCPLGSDQIHFDAAGAEMLGKRVFQVLKPMLSEKQTSHTTPIMGWNS